nr:hypothetical protein [Candidatus Sigynarchaeota archaeon]
MNEYLTLHANGIEAIPDMTSVLKVIELYDVYEIANLDSFPEWRNHVLEHYFDIEAEGKFALSFDPTPEFKKFMNKIFQAQYYKAADEKWKKAEGESMSVGLLVQQAENADMIKAGIDSTFIILRIVFNYENIADVLPIFQKRFGMTYKEFLREAQDEIKGMLSFGYYSELPTEL